MQPDLPKSQSQPVGLYASPGIGRSAAQADASWSDHGFSGAGTILPWLGWKFSIVLPIAMLLIVASVLWSIGTKQDLLEITVLDSSSGYVLPGALVTIDSRVYRTNDDGVVRIERLDSGSGVTVSANGYSTTSTTIVDDPSAAQQIAVRPSTLIGTLTDRESGNPIAEASLTLVDARGAELATTKSDAEGGYRFVDVPGNATLRITAGSYGSVEAPVGNTASRDFVFELRQAQGLVVDPEGKPIQGAVVRSGDVTGVTGGDGTFTLEGVGNGAELTISASGFGSVQAVVNGGRVADVRLDKQLIKGIYANWSLLTSPGGLDDLIEIANTTEVNAIVIDIKQDTVYYDSQVRFFRDAGTVNPIMDVNDILKKLRDNDIYAIARLVVFQDPLVAEARPDLAVKDVEGELWVNEMGVAWVNAFNEELWDANIALATEATQLGFDEIQYDYVRFPSDGDLTTADFGRDYTAEAREAAITTFMKQSYEAIHAEGGRLAADLFGFVTIVDDEQYIGQRFSALAPYLDYVCMMIYPSHFSEGNIASAPGHPNDYPYETIFESLERAEQNVPGSRVKFRPWLQDFSYGYNGLRDYTKADVRAQIDAAEDFGTSGWLLWGDPFNVTVEALKPDPEM
jgi:hypothetical protein